MAAIQPARYDETDEPGPGGGRRRRIARYAVPVAVAGVAAATISLVPALADAGDPSLPSVTAEQLLTRIAASDTRTLDGSVRISTDLGLPSALSGGAADGLFGGAGASDGSGTGKGSPAAPRARLTQLLAGTHQLHVSADGPDRQKVSIIETAAEYSVIHNGTQLWAYDSASNQAYHRTLPEQRGGSAGQKPPEDFPATPADAARQVLGAADGTASITVDGTARVAGHGAYELLVRPRHADSTTVGSIRIAVDAKTGVPLKLTLTPKGGGKAVFDIGFTRVSFAEPSASTFTFTPPKGVKVTEGAERTDGTAGVVTKGPKGFDSDVVTKGQKGADSEVVTKGPKGLVGDSSVRPEVIGHGWDSIAVVKAPGGLPSGGEKNGRGDAESLLNGFGTRVSGPFGSGTVFHTRLVNALLTDKGTLYVGAVTQSALTDAANAAR